jgi:hypothetical protein
MNQQAALIRRGMKTPRAAAIAGIIFSVLLISSQLLISISVSADAIGSSREIIDHSKTISFALNLLPFAGIAFLWFIGVVRDRLGEEEDRFFSTVFFGSGLLYIAMMFVSAALAGALIRLLSGGAPGLIQSGTYALDRAEIYQFNRVFGARMAGMFMISTCTISLRTGIAPGWIAVVGYALSLFLLLGVGTWIPLVFPVWIFLISGYILTDNFRGRSRLEREA